MTRIIDNNDLILSEVLGQVLPGATRLDACVGYFNIRGYDQIAPHIEAMRSIPVLGNAESPVRILLGMALAGDAQLQAEFDAVARDNLGLAGDRVTALQVAKRQVAKIAEQLIWGAPTAAHRSALQSLLEDLRRRTVTVKIFTERPLHAKLYLARTADPLNPGRAVVGSSNFTPSGLARQGELNLEETDHQKVQELGDWFEDHWTNPFTCDISEALAEVIENSWAVEPQPSPYHLHLKMAFEVSRDARSGKSVSIPEEIENILGPWQQDAIKIATRIVRARGLTVIGDVVGLGKTLVGLGVAASLGDKVLILCPPNLKDMWEWHLQEYGVPGKVLGISDPLKRELPNLRAYKTVLIDEAHNLRHTSRQIWPVVRDYISENNSRLILMTATMFNADVLDIAGQLSLKLNEDEDLGIQPEKHIETLSPEALQDFKQRQNYRLSTLSAFKVSKEADDWRRLLSLYLVRRTRAYLLERYALEDEIGNKYFEFADGRTFRFPKANRTPIEYPGGPEDPCDQLASVANFQILDGLTYARYQLGKYLTTSASATSPAEQQLIEDLERATASSGFIRTTILKRLASSPKAFFITVEKMLLRTHLLRWAMANGKDLPVGDLLDKYYGQSDEDEINEDLDDSVAIATDVYLDGSWAKGLALSSWDEKAKAAYESLVAKQPKKLRWARNTLFDSASLIKDLSSDAADLQGIIDEHGDWDANKDSKIRALADMISNLPTGEKLLVFSEYSDSISYVHTHLQRLLPNISIEQASSKSTSPATLARRFAPKANAKAGGVKEGETEIQVLLATDVLSEGHNLQDCARVVNWDIPWTIIKIIQRAGRVDRVGQEAAEIFIHTLKPHNGLEAVLDLVKRLRARLKENHELFGGEENFFEDELAGSVNEFFDGGEVNLPEIETDVDYASFAMQIWDSASEDDRVRAKAIGDASFTTKRLFSPEMQGQVLAHAIAERSEGSLIDYFALQSADGSIRSLTPLEALRTTSSAPGEDPGNLLDEHLDKVESILANRFTPLAKSDQAQGYTGIRGQLKKFLELACTKLAPASAGYLRAERLEVKLDQRGIKRLVQSEIREQIRRAKKSSDFESAVDWLWDLDLDDNLFTSAPVELTSLKISTSFGWNKN